jgi:pimeloyl-ACP methyl ester carboxylesterase
MTASDHAAHTDISFRRDGEGERAAVFVHGFLDDQHVWDKMIADLTAPGFETVQVDLAGMGDLAGASGPFTYERFAADVGRVVDTVGKPFVIVGQSMGAPIAELVAAARPEQALGLVLLAPVPLAGTRLPRDGIEPFRSLGGDPEGQRAGRRQLSVGLATVDLDRLVRVGASVRPEVVGALVDCWNSGLPEGGETSAFTGPVLIVRGSGDGFITEDVVSAAVSPRFASATTVAIEAAGHWPHLEQPSAVAALLDEFLTQAPSVGITAPDVCPQGWTAAFASKSADGFGAVLAEDVVLEAATLARPVKGREQVMRVMGTASGIYDSLVFTHEASNGPRTYLEWEATAFGGLELKGVTVLTKNDAGQIAHAAIHHRPLGAGLRFSAELSNRLSGAADPGYFYAGEPDITATR